MSQRIVVAKTTVEAARQSLIDTARELAQRLQPKTLAREAWESAKVKGADIAEDAVDAVKRRPVATGGIVAAIAMFLAREPIRDGVSRIYGVMTAKDEDAVHKRPVPMPIVKRKQSAPRRPRKTETK